MRIPINTIACSTALTLIILTLTAAAFPQAQTTSSLRVGLAQRAKQYGGSPTVIAKPTDIVLYIRIDGLTDDEWGAVRLADIAVSIDGRRFAPEIKEEASTTVLNGKVTQRGERAVVFVVPREQLKFSLVVGTRPPVAFQAETTIREVIAPIK